MLSRRQWLLATAGTLFSGLCAAQPIKTQTADTPRTTVRITQLLDLSPAQHDVSRDLLIGARLGWLHMQPGLRAHGWNVQHEVVETDGTPAAIAAAAQSAWKDPACLALSGCAGHGLAHQVMQQLSRLQELSPPNSLPLIAPWLMAGMPSPQLPVAWVFAGYEQQITHTVHNLTILGLREIGVAYGSDAQRALLGPMLEALAQRLGLRLQSIHPSGQVPAMTLFAGGTPELLNFVRHHASGDMGQRYLLALSDVNLQVLREAGAWPAHWAIIGSQPVPMLHSAIPLVQRFHQALSTQYDEAPTALTLAGFITALYTANALMQLPIEQRHRAGLAQWVRTRSALPLQGMDMPGHQHPWLRGYVTQSMLTQDRRVIG